jgi:hypothetical protein
LRRVDATRWSVRRGLDVAISTGWNYTIASINYHAVGFGSHTTAAWAPLVRIDRRYAVALYPYLVDKVLQRRPGVCGSLFLFGRKPR